MNREHWLFRMRAKRAAAIRAFIEINDYNIEILDPERERDAEITRIINGGLRMEFEPRGEWSLEIPEAVQR